MLVCKYLRLDLTLQKYSGSAIVCSISTHACIYLQYNNIFKNYIFWYLRHTFIENAHSYISK